jgi:uncharacterized protein (TIGR00369 family)
VPVPEPVLDPAGLEAFLASAFPGRPPSVTVLEVGRGYVRVRRPTTADDVRPGGTLSGPVLMSLADSVGYLLVAAGAGHEYLAVTSSLHVDFLRKPPADDDLVAEGRVLRWGRRLVVAHVEIRPLGGLDPVAVASVTYARA